MASLLEDILSRDPHRVWLSSCAIIKLRDTAILDELVTYLEEIRSATEGVNLGGMVYPNASHLAFALAKLEFIRDDRGCLCQLYPRYEFYDPKLEEATGNIIHLTVDESGPDDFTCTCANCGQGFHVQERDYHYTWWGWKAV